MYALILMPTLSTSPPAIIRPFDNPSCESILIDDVPHKIGGKRAYEDQESGWVHRVPSKSLVPW